MKGFLTGIAALALLAVSVELFLNEGETKKYVNGILRAIFTITLFVGVIKILPGINGMLLPDTPSGSLTSVETVEYIGSMRDRQTENSIVSDLKSMGIENAKVNIYSYYDGEKRMPNLITVDLSESGISENEQNIIGIEDIKKVVVRHVDIAEELISVYGWN